MESLTANDRAEDDSAEYRELRDRMMVRLRWEASTGVDLSPPDPVAVFALGEIERLEKEVDKLNKQLDRIDQSVERWQRNAYNAGATDDSAKEGDSSVAKNPEHLAANPRCTAATGYCEDPACKVNGCKLTSNPRCVCDPIPGKLGGPCRNFRPDRDNSFGDNADCLECGHWEGCHARNEQPRLRDLIKRLRAHAEDAYDNGLTGSARTCKEAADALERLAPEPGERYTEKDCAAIVAAALAAREARSRELEAAVRETVAERDEARRLLDEARASQPPSAAHELVLRQSADEGLWFQAETATEAYLQQELRKLHAAVEGEAIEFRPPTRADETNAPLLCGCDDVCAGPDNIGVALCRAENDGQL